MSNNFCVDQLDENSIKRALDYSKFINPYKWQKEHYKTHDADYSPYSEGRAAICSLPYEYIISTTSIGTVGECRCKLCGVSFDMTDYDSF